MQSLHLKRKPNLSQKKMQSSHLPNMRLQHMEQMLMRLANEGKTVKVRVHASAHVRPQTRPQILEIGRRKRTNAVVAKDATF